MVLFSGDGDFRSLVEAVQRHGVHVTVVSTISSQPPMIADELRRSSLRDQLEADDTGQDQADAYQPQRGRGFREQIDAERRGSDRTDSGPYRVSGPDRQRLERQPEQDDAQNHAGDGPQRRQQAGKAFGIFETDRPADLEQAGDGEIDPRHDEPPESALAAAVAVRRYSCWP